MCSMNVLLDRRGKFILQNEQWLPSMKLALPLPAKAISAATKIKANDFITGPDWDPRRTKGWIWFLFAHWFQRRGFDGVAIDASREMKKKQHQTKVISRCCMQAPRGRRTRQALGRPRLSALTCLI